MRKWLCTAALLPLIGAAACGGYGDPSPVVPGETAPPPGAITIDVVGINGSRSFSPDPATVPSGQAVVWHNVDTAAHRVMLNDGKLDTGHIAPGEFSPPMMLPAPGAYHCSIHPEMVGTLRVSNP